MPQPTINHDNKHILKEEFAKLSNDELDEFLHDDENSSKTTLGIVFENIDLSSQTIFKEVLNAEYHSRYNKFIDPRANQADQIDEDIEMSLLEAIRQSDILEQSLFAQSKMLDNLEKTADIPRVVIEAHLENKEPINEAKVLNNLLYTQINQALKVIQPIEKPEIKIDMNESVIWSVIRQNEDWLLESKLKTYLSAKKNEYQSLNIAEKSVQKEVYPDKVHELNKLQKLIYQGIKQYPDVNILSAKMDEGLERYKDIHEQFDIPVPLDNSLMSLYIRANELLKSEEIQNLIENAEQYLSEQAPSKPVQYSSIYDYKSIIQNDIAESAKSQSTPKLAWLGDYAIVLKETKDNFQFNIITKPFIKSDNGISSQPNQMEEQYKTDMLKSLKTLQKRYPDKKFTPSLNETGSVETIDTNSWRIHLYENLSEKNITYNIEYYPPQYQKSESEEFYGIEESKTAKQLEKYLLQGEHIFIKDTGVVLWHSASDRTFMIDMEKASFDELYKIYRQEAKRGAIEERNDPKGIKFKGGSGADREEIIYLAAQYNFHAHMITSYKQEQQARTNNTKIKQALKALGVTEISSGSNLIKL